MGLNISRILRRLADLLDVDTSSLSSGDNGDSVAFTWDNSAASFTATVDPTFDSLDITDTTASTSTTTGALTIAGGVGVQGDIYANSLELSGNVALGGSPLNNVVLSQSFFSFAPQSDIVVAQDVIYERLLGAPQKYNCTYTNVTNGDNAFDGYSENTANISANTTGIFEIDFAPFFNASWNAAVGTSYRYFYGCIVITPYTSPSIGEPSQVVLEMYQDIGGVDQWVSIETQNPPAIFPERSPIIFSLTNDHPSNGQFVKRLRVSVTAQASKQCRISSITAFPSRIINTSDRAAFIQSSSLFEQYSYCPGLSVVNDDFTAYSTLKQGSIEIDGTKVIGAQETGWTAGTGTASKGAFDTSTATTSDNAQRILAIEQALRNHGLIN